MTASKCNYYTKGEKKALSLIPSVTGRSNYSSVKKYWQKH